MASYLARLALLAFPVLVAAHCHEDNCFRGIAGTRPGKTPALTSRMADCSDFMKTTVIPATVTETEYVTTTTLDCSSAPTTDTFTINAFTLDKRAAPVAANLNRRDESTYPTALPSYATNCDGFDQYSSACSCWGFPPHETTLATPTTTVTSTEYVASGSCLPQPTCVPDEFCEGPGLATIPCGPDNAEWCLCEYDWTETIRCVEDQFCEGEMCESDGDCEDVEACVVSPCCDGVAMCHTLREMSDCL